MVSLRRTSIVWVPSGHWRRTRGALYVFHVMFVLYSCQGARDCKPDLGGKPDQRGGTLLIGAIRFAAGITWWDCGCSLGGMSVCTRGMNRRWEGYGLG